MVPVNITLGALRWHAYDSLSEQRNKVSIPLLAQTEVLELCGKDCLNVLGIGGEYVPDTQKVLIESRDGFSILGTLSINAALDVVWNFVFLVGRDHSRHVANALEVHDVEFGCRLAAQPLGLIAVIALSEKERNKLVQDKRSACPEGKENGVVHDVCQDSRRRVSALGGDRSSESLDWSHRDGVNQVAASNLMAISHLPHRALLMYAAARICSTPCQRFLVMPLILSDPLSAPLAGSNALFDFV